MQSATATATDFVIAIDCDSVKACRHMALAKG
jgi:hypothetical protein